MDDDSFDVWEYPIDDVRRPGPDDAAAIREQRPDKPPRRGRPRPESAATTDENGDAPEEGRKKRYPHQKAPKNLSTDQFLEKLKEDGSTVQAAPKEHKRRRGRSGKDTEERPEGAAEAPKPVEQ